MLRAISKRLFARKHAAPTQQKLRSQWKPALEPLEERELLYAFLGGTWPQPGGLGNPVNVSYSYSNLFSGAMVGVTNLQMVQAVEEALSLWARYAPFTFTEVADPGQIRLFQGDLIGSTLAQAAAPPDGDVTFDSSSRTWSVALFLETAAHEFGHSLGLGHSTLSSPRVDHAGAAGPPILNPTILNRYSGLGDAFLFQDDVNGIRARYGTGAGEVITNRNWEGSTSSNWDTSTNWGLVSGQRFAPTANSNVFIGATPLVTISSAGTRGARAVMLGNGGGQIGQLTVSAGTLNVKYFVQVGTLGTGTLTQTGGIINAVGINFGGNSAALMPLVDLAGGNLNVTGPVTDGTGTSTLQVRGGTLNVSNLQALAVDRFIYNTGTVNIGNGPVTVKNLLQLRNVTLAIPNLTLQGGLTLDPAAVGVAILGNSTSNVNLFGGVRDFTVADTDPFNADLVIFANLSNGGLRKLGPGALQFSANQSYTGVTDIQQGVLIVNGALASSSTTIAAGTTLTGTATLNSLISNGNLSPGNSAGTTTINGSFTQNATGQLNIEIGGSVPGVSHDRIEVSGTASLGGKLHVSLIDGFLLTQGATFDVLRASSISIPPSPNSLTLTGPYAGNFTYSIVNVGGNQVLRLTVVLASLTDATIRDDGDAGFTSTGGFILFPGQGLQNDVRYAEAGSGSQTATWTFTVSPGLYRISATWTPHPNRATNAPFTILDGATTLATLLINQELAPNDFTAAGVTWKNLGGPYNISTTTTLTVRLSNLADEYVIADGIRLEQLAVNPVQIIDDGDAGFSATGGFTPFSGQGYLNGVNYSIGDGSSSATWTFSVSPGFYKVAITWTEHPNRATNAPFTVLSGSTALGTFQVNQELAPADFTFNGAAWKDLGAYSISGTTLVVRLTDLADEYVIADAVRIERLT